MKFLIKTLGCRVNQAETREIAEGLKEKGWREGEPPELLILNTCCVTQKAEKETRQTARALKRKYPKSFLIIAGCAVDYWQMEGKLPDLGADLYLENERKMAIPNLPKVSIATHLRGVALPTPRVFLKVQDGCDQFCFYCIVPYLRGRSQSKRPEKIIKEIKQLEKKGANEAILCGINLADYRPSLVSLLKKILKETKIPRIRLGSINLEAFSDDFISLWQNSRLCPHFHIPLQSACNQTLRRMGRNYTFEKFKEKIDKLRHMRQFVNVTTDLMVGFPGETEEEFNESFKNLQSLKLGKIHVFRYSPREGTRAAKIPSRVPEKVKKERAALVLRLSQKQKKVFVKKFIEKKLRVLFEKEKDGYLEGLSENYLRVKVKGSGLRGEIKDVRIEAQKGGLLDGRIESQE